EVMQEVMPVEGTTMLPGLYLPPMYHSETGAAKRILTALRASASRLAQAKKLDWTAFFARLQAEDKVTLTEQQQAAVRAALENKISVLTGGPGTGKTTTLRAVIRALEQIGARYELASPTGRAAKRLSEATGRQARTIHRMLGFSPREGFTVNEHNPLKADM